MPPRESADAAAEDAALDGTPVQRSAGPEPSDLAGRYGRTNDRRRGERLLFAGAAAAFAVVLIAWVVWAGLDGVRSQVQATDLGHRLLDDRAVEVTWRLSAPPDAEAACIVKALNEDFTVVGWKVVELPPSDRHLRTFTERVRTAQPANTGLVDHCWLV